ncbi:MAG: hypothetical protein NXI08_17115 [bacterium]|nr:hypothetical protein [bacterium]
MVDYSRGKIYKIWDIGYNMCYVGSTTQSLSKRWQYHKADYAKFQQGKSNYSTVYSIFEEFGLNNCKIELVENVECQNKEELLSREGFYQRECECVNKCIVGQNCKEHKQEYMKIYLKHYYENNKDRIKQQNKEYREANKDDIQIQRKAYREANKDTIKEKDKKYQEANKDKIKETKREYYELNKNKLNEVIQCECGSSYIKKGKNRHEKTLKHQEYLKSFETMD